MSTIDGLASGLSTSSLISSLMQVEAAPQASLKGKVTKQQSAVTAYQSVNTKLAALEAAAKTMGQLSTWRSVAATSSSSSVTATAVNSNASSTGSVTFDVKSLARAQMSTARVPAAGDVTGGANMLTITVGNNESVDIDVSEDNSAAGVASAINANGLGIKATVVTTAEGETVLQLTGTKTGQENAFTVSGLNAVVQTPTEAKDAVLQVGDLATGGYTVSSSSNSFTKLITGTTITVNKEELGVTVEAKPDSQAVADKMKALVEAANSALSDISSKTAISTTSASGTAKTTGAALSGDFMVRQIADKILGSVSAGGSGDYKSLSKLGVELSSGGKLTFNAETFKKQFETDPTGLREAAATFAEKVEKVADDQQTNVTNAVTSRTTVIKSLNDQISNWDIRLSARKRTLEKQFTGLETAMSKMKNQSNWLSGQIASLG